MTDTDTKTRPSVHDWADQQPQSDRENWNWNRRCELLSHAAANMTGFMIALLGSKAGADPILDARALSPETVHQELRKFLPVAFDLAAEMIEMADTREPRL